MNEDGFRVGLCECRAVKVGFMGVCERRSDTLVEDLYENAEPEKLHDLGFLFSLEFGELVRDEHGQTGAGKFDSTWRITVWFNGDELLHTQLVEAAFTEPKTRRYVSDPVLGVTDDELRYIKKALGLFMTD